MMNIMRVGVDLAKNVFHVHGVDRNEEPVWRRRLTRGKWLKTLLEKVEPGCEIGMEACTGAHHWARELQARGYTVKLIAPIAMEDGLRFAIREGGRTVGAGVVSKVIE